MIYVDWILSAWQLLFKMTTLAKITKITAEFPQVFSDDYIEKVGDQKTYAEVHNLLLFFWRKYPSENYYLVMVGLDADLDEALDHFKHYR